MATTTDTNATAGEAAADRPTTSVRLTPVARSKIAHRISDEMPGLAATLRDASGKERIELGALELRALKHALENAPGRTHSAVQNARLRIAKAIRVLE